MSAVWLVGLALGFAGLVRWAWHDWQIREREKQDARSWGLKSFHENWQRRTKW